MTHVQHLTPFLRKTPFHEPIERLMHGQPTTAGELWEEGIRLARQADAKSVLSWMLVNAASSNSFQGKIDRRTEAMYRESLTLFRELRYKNGSLFALCQLGRIALLRGEDEQARAFLEQSLMLGQQIGQRIFNGPCLIGLAEIFCENG